MVIILKTFLKYSTLANPAKGLYTYTRPDNISLHQPPQQSDRVCTVSCYIQKSENICTSFSIHRTCEPVFSSLLDKICRILDTEWPTSDPYFFSPLKLPFGIFNNPTKAKGQKQTTTQYCLMNLRNWVALHFSSNSLWPQWFISFSFLFLYFESDLRNYKNR